jgi:hypothetical protein
VQNQNRFRHEHWPRPKISDRRVANFRRHVDDDIIKTFKLSSGLVSERGPGAPAPAAGPWECTRDRTRYRPPAEPPAKMQTESGRR